MRAPRHVSEGHFSFRRVSRPWEAHNHCGISSLRALGEWVVFDLCSGTLLSVGEVRRMGNACERGYGGHPAYRPEVDDGLAPPMILDSAEGKGTSGASR